MSKKAGSIMILTLLVVTCSVFAQTQKVVKKGMTADEVRAVLGQPDNIKGNTTGKHVWVYDSLVADDTKNAVIIDGPTGIQQQVVLKFNDMSKLWAWALSDPANKVTLEDASTPKGLTGEKKIAALGAKIKQKGKAMSSGELFGEFCKTTFETFGGRRDARMNDLITFLKQNDLGPEVYQCRIYMDQDFMNRAYYSKLMTRRYSIKGQHGEMTVDGWLQSQPAGPSIPGFG